MKEVIKKTYTQLTTSISDSLSDLKDAAKAKSQAFIDDWLEALPILEKMGLEMTSFGVALALSPALEVEMKSVSRAFTDEIIQQYMDENASNTYVTLVLKTIRTTRSMHARIGSIPDDEKIYVKIIVKVPPEVRVYFGKPKIV